MAKVLKLAEAGIVALAAIFAPIKGMLIATATMIIIDLISGLIAAKKQGKEITSAGLRRTISKLVIYEIALMLAFIAERYISDIVPFTKLASTFVSVVELKSIYENLNIIGGMDILKVLIDKLGSANQDVK